jgi:hypothetical protein
MSELTEWIKYELYPSLFEVIPQALPEHNFRKVSGDWNSKTSTKTVTKTSQEGTKPNETRATFIVNEDTLVN